MSYFVTGGTGFIGRFLIDRLLQREGTVFVLVRKASVKKLDALRPRWGAEAKRVVAVVGDLDRPKLGVSAADLAKLLPYGENVERMYFPDTDDGYGIAAGADGVVAVVGSWAVPAMLGRVAGVRSRELFLTTVLVISLGTAFATSYFGVSQAFGAFAAGMLVSRSRFAHQAQADIVPFRNIFAALFFVSLGMLANPRFMLQYWPVVLGVAALILVVKAIIYAEIMQPRFRRKTYRS